MANERLTVRVSRAVFDQIDRVLGPERGPHGEPSATDFLTVDLLAIVEVFATRFDELPRPSPAVPTTDFSSLLRCSCRRSPLWDRSPPTGRSN